MTKKYTCLNTHSVIFLCLLGLVCFLASCQKTNNRVAPRNPNGDSELALMMLDMFDEALEMKKQIENGEKPKVIKMFEQMHTAEATEPDKVARPIYKTFTDAYHESLNALKNANLGELDKSFNGVVQTCMNCHQIMCPGPIVRIEKLWVE